MDTMECILARRSIRNFTEESVDHMLLEQVIAKAAYAPTWKNTQISRYIIIEDPAIRAEISEKYTASISNARTIKHAPIVVAQTFIKSRSGFERDGSYSTDRKEGWQYYDCGIAAQTFCIAAHDLGFGTVIIGIFDRKGLEKFLQVPEEQELMALIAVGYAAQIPNAPKRKTVEELVSYR